MTIEDGSFIFARHTKRADGKMGFGAAEGEVASLEYPHVTQEGVEKAKETARQEFVPMIETSASNSVLFIGGSSEEARTKETGEIIGNEVAAHYTDNPDVKVFTKEEIETLDRQAISKMIEENKDKKLVFTFPLYLKELSLRPDFRDKQTGEYTDVSKKAIAKAGVSDAEVTREFFSAAENDSTVPSPQETAELQLKAIQRLQNFAKKFTGDRPVQVGIVGHGYLLDTLALYLANNGVVDTQAYQDVLESNPIDQAETGKISVTSAGIVFSYRGKEYLVPKEILKV